MSICCTPPVEYSLSMDKCARIGGACYPWMTSTIDEFLLVPNTVDQVVSIKCGVSSIGRHFVSSL